jgi:UDP-N-acetylglucosamine acyltransferase
VSASVHPSSVVAKDVELGEGAIIGPFCVVEGPSRIGEGTLLKSHAVVGPHTEIGEACVLFPHSAVGLEPQDLKFKGAPTKLVIGNRNVFRENTTVHRGTEGGGGITKLGDDNFLMAGAHVAHDCIVGDKNILANSATLAGHVDVGSGCNIGAFSAVHQFCRVGDHAFIGGFTVVTQDALPFMKTVGARDTKSYGVNTIGLQRKGFSAESVDALKKAHRILFHGDLLREEALNRCEKELGTVAEVAYLLRFIRESKRGIHRG